MYYTMHVSAHHNYGYVPSWVIQIIKGGEPSLIDKVCLAVVLYVHVDDKDDPHASFPAMLFVEAFRCFSITLRVYN